MKKLTVFISIILAMILCVSGCASSKPAEDASAAPETSADAGQSETPGNGETDDGAEFPSYVIGHNCLQAGDWSNDMLYRYDEYYLKSIGMTVNFTSANFSSEQMLKDVQNLIGAGEDGHMYVGSFGTLTPTVSDLFKDSKVYFAMYDQPPLEEVMEQLNANPYYTGFVGPDNVAIATTLAEKALELGYRKAALMGGAIGDVVHDLRLGTFEKVFEAGGGEVVAIARVSGADEAVQKIDDIMAAYGNEIDCFYGINMTGVHAATGAMQNYGLSDIMCIASEADTVGLELIKEGKLICDAAVFQSVVFTNTLLINTLDGHAILDENGNAPLLMTTKEHYVVTEDRADNYQQYVLDGNPIPDADYANLLYRNNPDASYEQLLDYMDNFTYEYVVEANS